MENEEFIAYRLMHSSSETVFKWLKSNRPDDEVSPDLDRTNLEKILLGRNDPIINIGLALYGSEPSTGLYLLHNGDGTIKKAVLSGTTISSFLVSEIENKLLKNLLNPFDDKLLFELRMFVNKHREDVDIQVEFA